MKPIRKFSFFAAAAVVLLSLFSCNKELEPIVLTGSWDLDTNGVMVQIIYSPVVANEFPDAVKFLGENIQKIRRELMKPQRIVFKMPNITEFYYNEVPLPVAGTFMQENAYFVITNPLFPESISGASDNIRVELYYDENYLMGIIYRLLTPEDDPPMVFEELIVTFNGVGAYKKALN